MPLERSLHDSPLNAAAPAVHEPHFNEPSLDRRIHIRIDDRPDIARRERVQIDFRLDRHTNRLVHRLVLSGFRRCSGIRSR